MKQGGEKADDDGDMPFLQPQVAETSDLGLCSWGPLEEGSDVGLDPLFEKYSNGRCAETER